MRHEVEFLLPWPPGESAAGQYLHGFIDCVYQDARGRWRLLDYKTNRVAAGGVGELAERYELQMLIYALACEQALGESLQECTLVALASGGEHGYRRDAEARRSSVERINRAMETLLK